MEHQHTAGIWLLYRLLPVADPPNEISSIVDELKDIYENELYTYDNIEDFSYRLYQDIDANKTHYENFRSVFQELPDAKFYGQWGASHIHLKKHSSIDWIAKLIKNSPPTTPLSQ